MKGGRRVLKAYTVTEDQLENLGVLQVTTTGCFSLASALLTFWIGVKQDIAFAGEVAGTAAEWWNGLAAGALFFAVLFLGAGIYFLCRGRTTVGRIKKDTTHE